MNLTFWRFPVAVSCLVLGFSSLLPGQSYSLTTIAGRDRLGDGGSPTDAGLRYPYGIAQDANGVTYIVDRDDNRVRRVANGVITTFAGTGRAGYSGDNGQATSAELRRPTAVQIGPDGSVYIADYDNVVIRKVSKAGIISTVVGMGQYKASGDDGPAINAGIDPFMMVFDSDGNLYISDRLNHRIRKVTTDGKITTIAGIGTPGYSGDNGPATSAAIYAPFGIAVDAQKNIYFADAGNYRVRKIAAATGIITTVAGNGILDYSGDEGQATLAKLYFPYWVGVEANGDIVIGSVYDIRRVTAATGVIHFVTGDNPDYGYVDGALGTAVWGALSGLTVAPGGDILVSDPPNFRVRRISSGLVTTFAGTGLVDNIDATLVTLNKPAGMFIAGPGEVWVADRLNNEVRSIQGGKIKKVYGDGYPTSARNRLYLPAAIVRDSQGSVYIAEQGNERVLKFAPGSTTGSYFAGGGVLTFGGDNGPSPNSSLTFPSGLAIDSTGVVYIVDSGNCRVRRVATNGIITTVVGSGTCLYSGDGGPATSAGTAPFGIALDGKGGLLITDSLNQRVRRVDTATGIITTVAGIGTAGFSGDGGPATSAQLDAPIGIAVDSAGRIFVADNGNSRVRMIDTNGVIRTIAGTGRFASTGETGAALAVSFDPLMLAVDTDGSIYVSDEYNDRVRKLTPIVPATLQITQGQNATGGPGDKITIQVKVIDAGGIPVAGIPVNFKVASGSATLSSIATNTASTGIAQIQATLGSTLGPVVITATVDGLSAPATINMTIAAAAEPQPQLDDAQVVGAALSVPSVRAMSMGGIMSAFGKNFGVGAAFKKVGTGDLVNGNVPTQFSGICVDISGTRALVFGASDTQVNFQVPSLPVGNAQVKVITGCGTASEKSTNAITVPVQAAAPEFFYFVTSTTGKNPVAAIDSSTGAYLVSPSFFPGAPGLAAAKPGQTITVFGTGFGDTDPSVTPGTFFAGAANAKGTVRVLLNGQALPATNVLYSGITPASPGLYQLNIKLPDTTPDGDLPLIIEIGGVQSSVNAFLAVKR